MAMPVLSGKAGHRDGVKMATVKQIVSAQLSQRQRQINQQAERAMLFDPDRLLCNIIRVDSNIDVPARPGFIWCQEYSPLDDTSPFHAFNDKVQAREGLTVWIGKGLGGQREVLTWNNGTIVNTADYAAQKYLPTHHSDHEWPDFKPGPDVVNVYPRSLSMLRTYPGEAGALTVSASPLRYIKGNALVVFPGKNSLDISASQPASGLARFVGIYLDPDDNTLKSINGATTGDSPAITPDSPAFPESAILSANVRLNGDQTVFSEVDMVDVRQILDASGAIDGVRVSKLVSPDGLTDPVMFANNAGQIIIGVAPAFPSLFNVEATGGGDVARVAGDLAGGDVTLILVNTGDTDAATTLEIEARQGTRLGGEIVFGRENALTWASAAANADGFISFSPVLDNVNTERMRITSSGDVGIGTTGPDARLDILNTGGAQLHLTFEDGVKFTSLTVDTNHDLTIKPTSTGQVIFQPTIDSADFFQVLDADGGTPVFNVDSTNESVGVRIQAVAYTRQGVTITPTMHIVRSDVTASRGLTISTENDTAARAPIMEFIRARVGPAAVADGDICLDFLSSAYDGTDYNGGARISGVISGAVAANTVPTRLQFQTTETNSPATRLAIYPNGDIIIGPNATPAAQLHIDQSSASAAQPVALFDQANVSEEMFEFVSTIGVGNAIEAVGAKTLTPTHFIKVTVPGGLTRYLEVGTIA